MGRIVMFFALGLVEIARRCGDRQSPLGAPAAADDLAEVQRLLETLKLVDIDLKARPTTTK